MPGESVKSNKASAPDDKTVKTRTQQSAPSYNYALEAGTKISSYRIVKPLGHGGMGEVYLATHIMLRAQRAIKIIRPDIVLKHASSTERFLEEARLQTHLNHPNVIQVHDIDYDNKNNIYYIVMEYVDGESVKECLKRKETFSEKDGLEVALKVAETLGHVTYENKLVVHRDIKPDNIMLTSKGNVIVADWGIAMIDKGRQPKIDISTSQAIKSNTIKGTPSYIAPEQVLDPDHVDCRADIYALGVTLYEMLSGEKPYRSGTTVDSVREAQALPVPDIRKKAKVSEMTSHLLGAMMAKSPDDRIESWEILSKQINYILHHLQEKLDAPPPAKRKTFFNTKAFFARKHEELARLFQGKWIVLAKKASMFSLLLVLVGFCMFIYLVSTAEKGKFKEIRLAILFYWILPEKYYPVFVKYEIEPPLFFRYDNDDIRRDWIREKLPREAEEYIGRKPYPSVKEIDFNRFRKIPENDYQNHHY